MRCRILLYHEGKVSRGYWGAAAAICGISSSMFLAVSRLRCSREWPALAANPERYDRSDKSVEVPEDERSKMETYASNMVPKKKHAHHRSYHIRLYTHWRSSSLLSDVPLSSTVAQQLVTHSIRKSRPGHQRNYFGYQLKKQPGEHVNQYCASDHVAGVSSQSG
ncbi:hypothetical protein EDB85DRAFT_2010609 [Lactarius pseudohatsudake]|nr:hypothetical protein EDB85DRAFT_2010609 [Lactarius pseudohatsudake]